MNRKLTILLIALVCCQHLVAAKKGDGLRIQVVDSAGAVIRGAVIIIHANPACDDVKAKQKEDVRLIADDMGVVTTTLPPVLMIYSSPPAASIRLRKS